MSSINVIHGRFQVHFQSRETNSGNTLLKVGLGEAGFEWG
jgi:hypothetical protein